MLWGIIAISRKASIFYNRLELYEVFDKKAKVIRNKKQDEPG